MRRLTTLIAGLGVLAASVSTAHSATIIINDNFDSYADQAAFQAAWTPSGTSNNLTSAISVSAPNSVRQDAGATTLNIRTFSASTATDIVATDSNPLVWSYMFYDDPANLPQVGNTLGRSYGQLHGRQASNGALNQLFSMGLWNANIPKASDGVVSTIAELRQYYAVRVAFSPGANWVLLDTAPQRSAGWHELKAVIGSTQVEFFVDGVSAYTSNYVPAQPVGWYQARIGSGLSSGTANNYDNYYLAVVPEPASLALLGLGLVGLFAGARRRSS